MALVWLRALQGIKIGARGVWHHHAFGKHLVYHAWANSFLYHYIGARRKIPDLFVKRIETDFKRGLSAIVRFSSS